MEFKENEAIYLQIAVYIGEQIMGGKWNSQEKIPSVRELASIMEVNPNTVMRAYEYLENNNIILNRRGIGFFVEKDGAKRLMDRKKENFFNQELPDFFRKIHSLNIEIRDLEQEFENFKKKQEEKIKL